MNQESEELLKATQVDQNCSQKHKTPSCLDISQYKNNVEKSTNAFIIETSVSQSEQILLQQFQNQQDGQNKETIIQQEVAENNQNYQDLEQGQKTNKIQNLISDQTNTIEGSKNLKDYDVTEVIQQKQSRNFKYKKLFYNKSEVYSCFSFAFNKSNTVLFVGQAYGQIKLYGFNNFQKQIQTLNHHTSSVVCLIYTQRSNQLISGSDDNTIIIYNLDQNNQWSPYQTLQDHTDYICCMITNKDEDLLISGSYDKTIIVRGRKNLDWFCLQIIDAQFEPYCLSFSPSQQKLISCGRGQVVEEVQENFIKVIEHLDQKWVITQTIKVDDICYRLCYIDENQFAFQGKQFLEIYSYENSKQQFFKTKQVQVQSIQDCYSTFPSQFLAINNILISKHGKYINFFGIDQDGQFELKQTLQFGRHYLYGKLTNDGQFLITSDGGLKGIQVMNLKYLD